MILNKWPKRAEGTQVQELKKTCRNRMTMTLQGILETGTVKPASEFGKMIILSVSLRLALFQILGS